MAPNRFFPLIGVICYLYALRLGWFSHPWEISVARDLLPEWLMDALPWSIDKCGFVQKETIDIDGTESDVLYTLVGYSLQENLRTSGYASAILLGLALILAAVSARLSLRMALFLLELLYIGGLFTVQCMPERLLRWDHASASGILQAFLPILSTCWWVLAIVVLYISHRYGATPNSLTCWPFTWVRFPLLTMTIPALWFQHTLSVGRVIFNAQTIILSIVLCTILDRWYLQRCVFLDDASCVCVVFSFNFN